MKLYKKNYKMKPFLNSFSHKLDWEQVVIIDYWFPAQGPVIAIYSINHNLNTQSCYLHNRFDFVFLDNIPACDLQFKSGIHNPALICMSVLYQVWLDFWDLLSYSV